MASDQGQKVFQFRKKLSASSGWERLANELPAAFQDLTVEYLLATLLWTNRLQPNLALS